MAPSKLLGPAEWPREALGHGGLGGAQTVEDHPAVPAGGVEVGMGRGGGVE